MIVLQNMIMSFRVAELQMLLGFAGKSKSGKKNELQAQALDLLKGRSLTLGVQNKIKELHRQRYTHSGFALVNSDSSDSDNNMSGMTTRSAAHAMMSSQNHLINSGSNAINNMQNSINKQMNAHQMHARNDFYGSMPRALTLDYNSAKGYQSMAPNVAIQYPMFPDVRFKPLPFYDILGDLLKPSSLSMILLLIQFLINN